MSRANTLPRLSVAVGNIPGSINPAAISSSKPENPLIGELPFRITALFELARSILRLVSNHKCVTRGDRRDAVRTSGRQADLAFPGPGFNLDPKQVTRSRRKLVEMLSARSRTTTSDWRVSLPNHGSFASTYSSAGVNFGKNLQLYASRRS